MLIRLLAFKVGSDKHDGLEQCCLWHIFVGDTVTQSLGICSVGASLELGHGIRTGTLRSRGHQEDFKQQNPLIWGRVVGSGLLTAWNSTSELLPKCKWKKIGWLCYFLLYNSEGKPEHFLCLHICMHMQMLLLYLAFLLKCFGCKSVFSEPQHQLS